MSLKATVRKTAALLCLSLLFGACSKAPETQIHVEPELPVAAPDAEIRAVWVSVLGPGLRSREEIEELVATVRKAHLNTIVAQVRREGAAMYRSKLQPRHASLSKQPDFDPLATLLEVARDTSPGETPLQVHAWFNIFRLGEQKPYLKSTPPPIAVTHADWFTRNHEGDQQYELDPGVPAVQDHLIAVIEECLRNYDVDGINLDYIRYFGNDRGYNPWALKRFYRQTGLEGRPGIKDEPWSQFKRDQVSHFVRRCAITVWTLRPDSLFSVNAVGWGSAPRKGFFDTQPYFEAMQDWSGWIEQGWVDAVLKMSYKREWEAEQKQHFRDWADYSQQLISKIDGRIVTMGMGGYFNPLEDTLTQYREASTRNLGTSLFVYDRPTQEATEGKGDEMAAQSKLWERLGSDIYSASMPAPEPDWRTHLSFIAGYVVDSSGQPVDGVEVSLSNTGYSARTDGSGFVAFSGLPPGTYQIACSGNELDGHQIETVPGKVTWISEE